MDNCNQVVMLRCMHAPIITALEPLITEKLTWTQKPSMDCDIKVMVKYGDCIHVAVQKSMQVLSITLLKEIFWPWNIGFKWHSFESGLESIKKILWARFLMITYKKYDL